MKLYKISHQSRSVASEWVGTQDEAKKRAKEVGGFFDHVEVPTDKQGLLDWLNANTIIEGKAGCEDVDPLEAAELRAVEASQPPKTDTDFQERRAAAVARQQDTNGLIDWMLDEAQPWQLEAVFAALASRLHQLFRG
jgi:hypothetical protein